MMNIRKPVGFVALVAAVAAMPLLPGCEKAESQANRKVAQNIAAADEAAANKAGNSKVVTAAGAPAARPAGYQLLDAAAKESAASLDVKATAKARVGQSNYASAMSVLPDLAKQEDDAHSRLRSIAQLGSLIAADNRTITAYRASNPSGKTPDTLAALKTMQEKLLGEAAGYEKQVQEMQGEKTAIAAKITELQTKIAAANSESATAFDKAEQTKGEESVNHYKAGLASRKISQDFSNQLDLAKTDLARKETQIVDTGKKKTSAENGAAVIASQSKTLSDNWTATQQAIEKRAASQQDVLNKASIDALAKEFAAIKAEADRLRTLALDTYLAGAISMYSGATNDAKNFTTALSAKRTNSEQTNPQRPIWDDLIKAFNPVDFKIAEARAHNARGGVFLNQKHLLESQKQVADSLAAALLQAGLKTPEALAPADLADQLKAASASAKKEFEEAITLADYAIELPNNSELVNEARDISIAAHYALYHLDNVATHLAAAKSNLQALNADGIALPAFPSDLEASVKRAPGPLPNINIPSKAPVNPVQPVNPEKPTVTPENPTPNGQPATGGGRLGKLLDRAAGAFKGKGGEKPPEAPPK